MSPFAALTWLASGSALACASGECDPRVRVGSLDVCVDLATTAAERLQGLRGHAPLGPGEGLLMRFPVEGEVCLVNDGVSFDVDAVLFDGERRVTHIVRLEADDGAAQCAGPAIHVLEVAGGAASGLIPGTLGALP